MRHLLQLRIVWPVRRIELVLIDVAGNDGAQDRRTRVAKPGMDDAEEIVHHAQKWRAARASVRKQHSHASVLGSMKHRSSDEAGVR